MNLHLKSDAIALLLALTSSFACMDATAGHRVKETTGGDENLIFNWTVVDRPFESAWDWTADCFDASGTKSRGSTSIAGCSNIPLSWIRPFANENFRWARCSARQVPNGEFRVK